jgi:hypothetical protein
MINEQSLTEKLKYLVKKDTQGLFDIQSFYLDISYVKNSNRTLIYEIDANITFDYLGPIDPDSRYLGRNISSMCDKLREVLVKNGITQEGKITLNGEHSVTSADIWNITFAVEETHIFEVSYRISYE